MRDTPVRDDHRVGSGRGRLRRRRMPRWRPHRTVLLQVSVTLGLLVLWQVGSATGALPHEQFPSAGATVGAVARSLTTGAAWSAVGGTLVGWSLGLLLAIVIALPVGAAVSANQFISRSVLPVVELFKTIPIVAILPLSVFVLGPTLRLKVALVAFGVVWNLIIQVVYGMRAVDPVARDTARTLHVTGARLFFTIRVPSAAPFLATGLRVAASTGLILEIIIEFLAGVKGLGIMILTAQAAGPDAYGAMYAWIVLTGVVGIAITGMLIVAERRALRWHESQRPAPGAGGTADDRTSRGPGGVGPAAPRPAGGERGLAAGRPRRVVVVR